MTQLREQMIRSMQLRRLSPGTQEVYVRHVFGLAKHYMKSPDQLTAQQISDYVLHMLNEKKLAWATVDQTMAGIMFFYTETLGRESMRLAIPAHKTQHRLPDILSSEELERLFTLTVNPKHRALLMTTYSAGLRVSEVTRLKITDIDTDRMMIRVAGKGNKDRFSLLSSRLLVELRSYWRGMDRASWLFPGKPAARPLCARSAERTFRAAAARAGITKYVTIHSLRHAFATHLLEAGVPAPRIQVLMGHISIVTTMRYAHVSRPQVEATRSPLDLIAVPDDKPLQ